MSTVNYKENLNHVKAFIFDVDGVLTNGNVMITTNGEMYREMNTKDGYAMKCALEQGFRIAIISGGTNEGVRSRLKALGVDSVYLGAHHKIEPYEDFIFSYDLKPEEIVYMGDDAPDIEVMLKVGLLVAQKMLLLTLKKLQTIFLIKKGELAVFEISSNRYFVCKGNGVQPLGQKMIEMYSQDFNSVEIILASNSPRRKQFFKEAGIPFTVKTFEVDEIFDPTLKGAAISNYLVKLKAAPFQNHIQSNQIVVTADTIVWGDDQYLGKPKTKADAKQMLRLLSGKEHQVITSVAFTQKNKQLLIHETSSVTFKKLSDQEIEFYVNEFEPMDKAGAYGIQEWIGTIGIERIEGSYTNIVGLPMAQVLQCLIQLTSN